MLSLSSFLLLVIISKITTGEDVFENSTNICSRCKCTNDDGKVFTLDCKEQMIHETLANWPQHNTSTFIATFSFNNITTLEKLPGSDAAFEVVFDHCGIKNLENGLFSAVKNVEFVDLSHNLLTSEEVSPDKFKGPYNNTVYEPIGIKHLNLAYNQIHSLSNNLFEHMQGLEVLNLEGNHFHVLDVNTQAALSTLTKLEILNLANNKLTELVEEAIGKLTNLKELDLSNNDLYFVPFTLPVLKESLEILYLSGNPIIELEDVSFAGMTKLVDVYLNNLVTLENVQANAFAPMYSLRKLQLSQNRRLTTIDRDAFATNQSLQELYLNNNSISFINIKLLNWSSLKVFDISNNPLECDCNLFNITERLSSEIRRNLDGPVCMDYYAGRSKQMFALTEEVCAEEHSYGIHRMSKHFNMLRWFLLSLSIFLTMIMFILLAIGVSRYRRYVRLQKYSFVTQVSYNPLNTQYRM